MADQWAVKMSGISFAYGDKLILDNFHLNIPPSSTYCLIGASGSGKTTTLRLMNGLLSPQKGSIELFGKDFDFSQAEKSRRSMGYSIQGSGLFPHMTLKENLSIIARKQKWASKKIDDRIQELCELLSLPGDKTFLKKRPRQISGGQQQRVGIARALFMKPKIMLMDEPFSALDPVTRSELQQEFLTLQEKLKMTIILVTHDLSEAFSMADSIVLLNQGKIEQQGRPSRFLLQPATDFVKSFIESHSPGNLLKEIYLYSVANTNVCASQKAVDGIRLIDMDTQEYTTHKTLEDAEHQLTSCGQGAHYWVDENFLFTGSQGIGAPSPTGNSMESLPSSASILTGMKFLLSSKKSAIPLIDRNKKFIGVFSEEALNAL